MTCNYSAPRRGARIYSRGLASEASVTPGMRAANVCTPEGCKESSHPSGVMPQGFAVLHSLLQEWRMLQCGIAPPGQAGRIERQRKLRAATLARETGRPVNLRRDSLFDLEQPPRLAGQGCFRPFLFCSIRPAWPGGAIPHCRVFTFEAKTLRHCPSGVRIQPTNSYQGLRASRLTHGYFPCTPPGCL